MRSSALLHGARALGLGVFACISDESSPTATARAAASRPWTSSCSGEGHFVCIEVPWGCARA
ncbi:MAG: hypothetical protein U0270_23155 [Labilithrix sp.]